MTKQRVFIDLYDESGINYWGTLKIQAESSQTLAETFFKENNISYHNVCKVSALDNDTPIQYYIPDELDNISKLVLMEETPYKVVFEVDDSFASKEIEVLPYLSSKNDFMLDTWDVDDGPFRAYLNFRSYAGKSFFNVRIGGLKSKKYPFEVRSKKIGYYKEYNAMISDLAQIASGMIFEQNAPLLQFFDFEDRKKETFYEEYMFLEYLFRKENLPWVYEFILRNPYSKLKKYSQNIPTPLAHNIGSSQLNKIASTPNNLFKTHSTPLLWPDIMEGHMPLFVDHDFLEDTLDTPENRLVKYFMESVDKLISDLLFKVDEGNIKDKLFKYQKIIQNYLSDRWLVDIGSLKYIPLNSQVMQKKEGYREIFKYFIYFEFAFRLKWEEIEDKLKGYERRLSELYEYWCYVRLLNILCDLSDKTLKFEEIYHVNTDKWSIRLKKGAKNAPQFYWTFQGTPLTISVVYGGEFHSYSLPLKPDYTLVITVDDREYLLHFDAKYRFKKTYLEYCKGLIEDLGIKNRVQYDFQTADLCKMHTYKDAIENTLGAYILYPGDLSQTFPEHEEFCVPSVGAFHLTPGGSTEVEESEIERFLVDVLEHIINHDKLVEIKENRPNGFFMD